MPNLTAIGKKTWAHENEMKGIIVDRPYFIQKHQENDYLELPLYKSCYNDNSSCMLSCLSVKMLVPWN